jgi:hypothetical protein
MAEQAKKRTSRKAPSRAPRSGKSRDQAEKQRESDDIERAVYDGMQDLRTQPRPGRGGK